MANWLPMQLMSRLKSISLALQHHPRWKATMSTQMMPSTFVVAVADLGVAAARFSAAAATAPAGWPRHREATSFGSMRCCQSLQSMTTMNQSKLSQSMSVVMTMLLLTWQVVALSGCCS